MTTARKTHRGTFFPVEEDVGESIIQTLILEVLRPLVARFLLSRGVKALVGADQFIYWDPDNPRASVSPDLYVLPGVDPGTRVDSWQTWVRGTVPSMALEVVSGDVDKDYRLAPRAYDSLGVRELLVFDPDCQEEASRVRWQVFRRVGKRGLVRVLATDQDRVRSDVLGCWLRCVGQDTSTRLRVALDPHGDDLLPTAEEAEQAARDAEQAARDAEQAARDAEQAARARAQAEQSARRVAEAEVERLRAELARLTGKA